MPTAILIDGDFFLRRYRQIYGRNHPDIVAQDLHRMCLKHLTENKRQRELYRIFFYDCPPLINRAHNPISGNAIDFALTPTAKWRLSFHQELRKLRKVALRMGYLNERSGHWAIHSRRLKELLARRISLDDLQENDVYYDVQQKGVDMRIGLDIASMAFKRQVDQIILVAGDSTFVPAAELARREGIDFILDPMWATIRPGLLDHIDGLKTVCRRKNPSDSGQSETGLLNTEIDSEADYESCGWSDGTLALQPTAQDEPAEADGLPIPLGLAGGLVGHGETGARPRGSRIRDGQARQDA